MSHCMCDEFIELVKKRPEVVPEILRAAGVEIADCSDLAELESWLRLSVSVSSADELFG